MVLDFALSLVFIHLVLTTYYSASIPTSLFFWLVVGVGALATVILAEQLCVKREMQEGLSVVSTEPPEEDNDGWGNDAADDEERMEMGRLS